jgi:hypothetical protein
LINGGNYSGGLAWLLLAACRTFQSSAGIVCYDHGYWIDRAPAMPNFIVTDRKTDYLPPPSLDD